MVGLLAASACKPRAACDREGVAALVEALAGTETGAEPALLREGLPKVCELPALLRRSLADPRRQLEERSPALLSHTAFDELRGEFERLCPGADTIGVEGAALPASERMAFFYDRCQLARFGVIDRDDQLRSGYGMPVWLSYVWLVDAGGLGPELAGDLMPALRAAAREERVVLTSVDGLEVPSVRAPLRERPEALSVDLTPAGVFLDREPIAALDAEASAPASAGDRRLPGLDEHLAAELERQRRLRAGDLAASAGPLHIAADRRSRFHGLADVLASAVRLGFTDVALLVEIDAFDRAALPLVTPPPAPSAAALWLELAEDGTIEARAPQPRPIGRDPHALAAFATERCAGGPASGVAVIEPAWGARVEAIVPAIVALRGEACGDHPGEGCCFPRVALAAPSE
ncbi:MAG: hypothetical protein H6711_24555 [Myxococcales bacterium]|nr:hypothetical protein [Myxococcales bacterium]